MKTKELYMEEGTIRIAQVIGKLLGGGVENVVFNYYRNIDRKKVQFDFFYDSDSTVEPPKEIEDLGARFYKVPPYQDTIRYVSCLREHFKNNKYQIVHSHINTLSVIPLFAAYLEGVPVRIVHNHSVPGGNELGRNILKYTLKAFSKVFSTDYFACSTKAGEWMFGKKTFQKGKVTVIYNAVDFNRFENARTNRDNNRKELELQDKLVIGHVGRFTYAKNHAFLLEIFSKIANIREDARLLLVGDGELREEIHKKVGELGIADKVIFAGSVYNPEYYYSTMDVVIIPSFFEGLSLLAVESQISKVPVVLSKAIPGDAIISDACQYMDLSDNARDWAKTSLEMIEKPVELNENANNYDIKNRAKLLGEWYINHIKQL